MKNHNNRKNSLDYIISKIGKINPIHGKKLKKNILYDSNAQYLTRANAFLAKYIQYLENQNKDIDFGIECYLKMTADFTYEQIRFLESGKYSNTSFDDVYKRVYSNPAIMEYYMTGLLLSQILWKHHYSMYSYFIDSFPKYNKHINSYLEVGGGHGLFISEAINSLRHKEISYHLIDISSTSIDLSRKFLYNNNITYINENILEFSPESNYDFITMGEVLEHVEQPLELLLKLKEILNSSGHIYLTIPTNAPAIDHIYLFKNIDDIREMIKRSGLSIIEEKRVFAEDVSEEQADKLKIASMYGAFLSK